MSCKQTSIICQGILPVPIWITAGRTKTSIEDVVFSARKTDLLYFVLDARNGSGIFLIYIYKKRGIEFNFTICDGCDWKCIHCLSSYWSYLELHYFQSNFESMNFLWNTKFCKCWPNVESLLTNCWPGRISVELLWSTISTNVKISF